MSTDWRDKWQRKNKGGRTILSVDDHVDYLEVRITISGEEHVYSVYPDGRHHREFETLHDLLPLPAAEPVKVDAEPVKNGYAVVCDCQVQWADTPGQAMEIARREIAKCRENCMRDGVWDGWVDDSVGDISIVKATHRATLVNPDDHYSNHEYEMRPVAAEPLVVEHHVGGGTMMMAAGYFDDLAELRRDAERWRKLEPLIDFRLHGYSPGTRSLNDATWSAWRMRIDHVFETQNGDPPASIAAAIDALPAAHKNGE